MGADLMDAGSLEILPCEEDQIEVELLAVQPHDADPDEWEASDDVKGGELVPELAIKARAEELRYLHDHGVYEYATREEARAATGKGPIRVKWIDSNKGDASRPNYRSRLVCTEVRVKRTAPVFSATPPPGSNSCPHGPAELRGPHQGPRPSQAHAHRREPRALLRGCCPGRVH